ncbi:Fic family protein [Candidatus Woesearchaeota archaeon]|nr:Fic family protein [Candidatus Woesearchaeota archaeon]
MVYLRTKTVKGVPYYYLIQSVRKNGKTKKIEKYIGRQEPSEHELETLKLDFLAHLQSKEWICIDKETFELIEKIRSYKPELKDEQLMDFCINFTYNTNAIEGNKLTPEETKDLFHKDVPSEKPFKDHIESFAHWRVFMNMSTVKKPLTKELILHWHKELFKQAKPSIAGKFRKANVRVAGYKAAHYLDVPYLIDEFIEWFKEHRNKMHPVELAAMTHLKFVKIHPFLDGNGRIARLLLNYVLNRSNYPMMTIEYKNRESYYTALDKFDETQEEEVFVKYIVESFLREHASAE